MSKPRRENRLGLGLGAAATVARVTGAAPGVVPIVSKSSWQPVQNRNAPMRATPQRGQKTFKRIPSMAARGAALGQVSLATYRADIIQMAYLFSRCGLGQRLAWRRQPRPTDDRRPGRELTQCDLPLASLIWFFQDA